MSIPTQITFQEMESSPAVEARVHESVEKLARFHDRLTSVRVAVTAPHRHHHKGKTYSVLVSVTLPGAELVASADAPDRAHLPVQTAVRDAFVAVTRRLDEHARRQRGEAKSAESRATIREPEVLR
ncbi:MAG: HPF/RaiA family ribosome-associated protein [Sorangiineae bacterium]|nr:HPF/RaiA family ribosome-associated protein [Polyangiaceae bacterium]MEB2321102.1 HPF/RaiA family ribosome-associated protein [Sorangiineae bacterium]